MGLRLRICSLCFFLSLTTICSQASENPVLNQRQNQILQNVVTGELNNSFIENFGHIFQKLRSEKREITRLIVFELPTLSLAKGSLDKRKRELLGLQARTDEYVKLKKSGYRSI